MKKKKKKEIPPIFGRFVTTASITGREELTIVLNDAHLRQWALHVKGNEARDEWKSSQSYQNRANAKRSNWNEISSRQPSDALLSLVSRSLFVR